MESGCKLFSALISNLKKNSGKSRFLTGSPIGSQFPQAPSNLKIGLKEAQCRKTYSLKVSARSRTEHYAKILDYEH